MRVDGDGGRYATSRVWATGFRKEETTHASYDVLAGWTNKYGLPQSLYADRASIYRCEGLGIITKPIAGYGSQAQFGRAMRQLSVELIPWPTARKPKAGWSG